MQVLADRKTAGRMTGAVKVNGRDKEPRSFARIMGALGDAVLATLLQWCSRTCRLQCATRVPQSSPAPVYQG